jgi:hypothetical protein
MEHACVYSEQRGIRARDRHAGVLGLRRYMGHFVVGSVK